MKKNFAMLSFVCAAATGSAIAALSAGDQYNLDQIAQGGPESLRNAAQNIYNSGAPIEVLDVLAEALLQNADEGGSSYIDALSWACKALGNSGKKRYYSAIQQVADEGNRKLRKHCERAANDLGGADGEQYSKGMTSLKAAHASSEKKATSKHENAHHSIDRAATNGSYKPISEITVGMSMQQAVAIAGPPTSTNSHITGKAFIPFNFKGSDSYRSIGHYKGQGRIVFSNSSAYSSEQRVLEVQLDTNESGYP